MKTAERLASRMRHRITLQAPAHVDDAGGGQIDGWRTVLEVAAEVLPTGGAKSLDNEILNSSQGYRVTFRHRTDIDTTWRLLWNGKPLAILSIADPDGRSVALLAFCQAGVPT